jgi:hypothetical protein
MVRLVLGVLLALLVGAMIGFLISPVWAFYGLRSAAAAQDVKSLSELVAFDDLRDSLKSQMTPHTPPQAPPPSLMKDPFGALKRAIEPVTAPKPEINVEPYLTPGGLLALTWGQGRASAKGSFQPDTGAHGPLPALRYWSPDRCRLAVTGPEGETVLTFKRSNLFTWKLVHAGLPPEEGTLIVPARPANDNKITSAAKYSANN